MGYEPFQGNSFQVLEEEFEPNSIHAVVTDPPYGVVEFQTAHVEKMREGTGGSGESRLSWTGRSESRFLGSPRSRRVIRKTSATSSSSSGSQSNESFARGSRVCGLYPVTDARGLQTTGRSWSGTSGDVLVRETKTLRGGDRPKGAHDHPEYKNVSSMPRVYWEPWLLYRKPFDGRLDDNLGEWQTGGLRRESDERPFTDLLGNGKTRKRRHR